MSVTNINSSQCIQLYNSHCLKHYMLALKFLMSVLLVGSGPVG